MSIKTTEFYNRCGAALNWETPFQGNGVKRVEMTLLSAQFQSN